MLKRFKIAYISTPIDFGGSDKVSLTFLRQADRTRFDIRPVCLVRPWEKDNVFVRELEKDHFVFTVPVARKPRSEGRDPFRVARCYRLIYRFLRTGSFDLVHTHGYFADIMGIPASKMLGIPHLSTCHGFIENDAKLKIYNLLDRFALRFSDRIIAVSGEIRSELMEKGIQSSRIVMIRNAVNGNCSPAQFLRCRQEKRGLLGLGEAEFAAGYAGRLSEEKGLRYLIQACARLRRSGIPLKLVLIGEGRQRRELEDLVKNEGMDGAVLFAGFVKDVERWLPALDVFMLPSLTEGTPMALLEAMAAGIPVVASAVGGVPAMIEHNLSGILVRPGNREDLAGALSRLYADAAQRTALSAAAKQVVAAKYSIEDWVSKLEAEYHALITGQAPR